MPVRIMGEKPSRPPIFADGQQARAFLEARIVDLEQLRASIWLMTSAEEQRKAFRTMLIRYGTVMGLLSMAYSAKFLDDTAYEALHNRLFLTMADEVH